MNASEIESALVSLIPSIKRDGAEPALLKYASSKNLAPAQLEHLGRAYNRVLVIAHTKTAATQEQRGDDVDILDVGKLVDKYMDSDSDLSANSKKANTHIVPGNYRSFTVGDSFRDKDVEHPSLGLWASFDKADADHPEQVGTYAKAASCPAQLVEDEEFLVQHADVMSDAAARTWANGILKLAHMSARENDFIEIAQDAAQLSPTVGAHIASAVTAKLASLRLAWHPPAPEDTRDFFIDRKKIASTVSALEDAWFEHSACAKVAREVKAAAKRPRGRSLPTVGTADPIDEDVESDPQTSRLLDSVAAANAPSQDKNSLGSEYEEPKKPKGNPHTLETRMQTEEALQHNPSRNLAWSPELKPTEDKATLAGVGGALGAPLDTAGTGLQRVMSAIADYNPQDRGLGAARGLTDLISDPRARATDHLKSRVRTMKERSTLQRLMLSDPVISKHNPADVVEAFNTIRSVNPAAAADINLSRLLVRESLGYQGTPIQTVAQLASINKAMSPDTKPKPAPAR
jgi:hypothetical protein